MFWNLCHDVLFVTCYELIVVFSRCFVEIIAKMRCHYHLQSVQNIDCIFSNVTLWNIYNCNFACRVHKKTTIIIGIRWKMTWFFCILINIRVPQKDTTNMREGK